MPETVYLIDVYSLVFQVFHAIPEMTSPRGLPTNAVFGFTRDILNILRQKQPDSLICAADPPGPVERETWYPAYKAERAPAPEGLVPQFSMVREMITSFGIPLLEIPGWEADDVIATLVHQAEARGMDVCIVSNDKDLRQLLSPQVKIYHVRKDLYLNADDLMADWGVRPDQVIDFQSLVGDAVDNVPGVPLVGPKKASALLKQWGTLDEVLAHADEAPGAKLKENLKAFADQARLSKRLVTLKRDLPLEFDWESARIGKWDQNRLQDLFRDYGFRRFGDEIRQLSKSMGLSEPTQRPGEYTTSNVDRSAELAKRQPVAGRTAVAPSVSTESPVSDAPVSPTPPPPNKPTTDVERSADSPSPQNTSPQTIPSPQPTRRRAVQQTMFGNEAAVPLAVEPAVTQSSMDDLIADSSLDPTVVRPGDPPGDSAVDLVADPAENLIAESANRETEPLVEDIAPAPIAILPRRRLEYSIVDTPETLATLAADLAGRTRFCVDLETTGLDPLLADIVGWAISCEPHHGWYIPVRGPAGSRLLPPDLVCDTLRPILENPALELANQNIKYDLLVLRRAKIFVTGVGVDSMIAHFLLEAGARSHGLDELARRYLGHEMIPISSLIGKGKQQRRMDEVEVARVAEYAVEDAEVAWELSQRMEADLKQQGLWGLYWDLERPLVEVLVEMQAQGIAIEVSQLKQQSDHAGSRLDELRREIHELAGHEFNIDSPKQLSKVLYQELGLPITKRTQTGASTDQEVLERLAPQHPLPAKMLDYRMLTKLKGTYLDALPLLVNRETRRLHCSFSQVAAATGRLSASEPNLQNVPVRTPEGKLIRRAFVASEPGWQLLCADYSQIELRVLAHFSQDPALLAAFQRGDDVHTSVAAQVFGVEPSAVDESQRRMAKAVNFGVIYGQSAFGLAANLQIPKAEAVKFIDGYFAKYAGVDAYLRKLLNECAATGYATTILGRRRPFEGIRTGAAADAAGKQRNLAERTAINTVIQGSAADLIKRAMLNLRQRLLAERSPARMLLQIHDELVLEAPAEHVSRLAQIVREEMTGAMQLAVPLKVDVTAGPNWLDQEDVAEL